MNTFLQLWKEAARARQAPASVAAWLAFTARLAAIERLRQQRELPGLAAAKRVPLEKSVSWLPAPREIALIDERRELLKKVVNQLPPSQLRAVELAVFGGYSETEIAEKLGELQARVRSELRASMRFLRHRLSALLGRWSANI